MYNEVDFKILESFIRCSYCDSKDVVKFGYTTTIAAINSWEDEDHHNHEHDNNCGRASYDCQNCGRQFNIVLYNSCWCGWDQAPQVRIPSCTNEEYIKEQAYKLWIMDGKPNGEEYIDSEFGRMKVKDIHWKRASIGNEVNV